MKTHIFFLLTVAFFIQSCGTGESAETVEPTEDATATEEPDGHNSRNSLDWMGTYVGVLPCDDCEEVQAQVTLEENGRFSRKLVYVGKSKTPLLSAGKFEWNESGSQVTLKSFKGNEQVFKVGENKLIYQLPEGVTGEYVLSKEEEQVEDPV